MSHFWRMLLGCMVPMLLIFVLPMFGVSEGVTLTVFIVLMLGCHLLMMRGHDSDHANLIQPTQGDDHAKSRH